MVDVVDANNVAVLEPKDAKVGAELSVGPSRVYFM